MELSGATVAVTGATGFIGRYLVRTLLQRGARVIAVVRNPDRVPAMAAAGVILRRADLADRGALIEGLRGADAVLSNAGLIGIGEQGFDALMRSNLEGTRNVLTAAAEAGVRRVVMTSSATVYRPVRGHFYRETDPLRDASDRVTRFGWYAVSKAVAEREAWRLAAEHDLLLSTFRPHAVHGAFDDHGATAWMRRLTSQPVGLWLAGLRFPSVYAGDLAIAACRMIERSHAAGKAYNLANEPDEHTFWDLLRAHRDAGGQASRLVIPLPAPLSRRFDLTLAKADLDFENRPLVEGFREMLALESSGAL